MARIFNSGFELNSVVDGMEFDDSDSGTKPSIAVTPQLTGQYTQKSVSARNDFRHKFSSGLLDSQVYARVWFYVRTKVDANTRVLYIVEAGAGDRVSLRLTPTNTLQLFGNATQVGTDSASLALNEWNCIELSYKNNTVSTKGEFAGRLNGTTFASTTTSTENGSWDSLIIGNGDGTATGEFYFDDLAVNDATGSFQTSWPGVTRLAIFRPSGTGDVNDFGTATGGVAGAANNYTRVMEVSPDTGTHNASATLNNQDMFTMSPLDLYKICPGDTINCITVHVRLKNNTLGDATTALKAQIKKSGGSTGQGTAIIPNDLVNWSTDSHDQPRLPTLVKYQDPDGADWTTQTIATMQCGYKLTAVGTNPIQVTALWAYVDFTPAARNKLIAPNRSRPRPYGPGLAR
jgi:hypothetical protein